MDSDAINVVTANIKNNIHDLYNYAVILNGYVLDYIVDQTEELCIQAVKRYNVSEYVKIQTKQFVNLLFNFIKALYTLLKIKLQ